MTESGALKTIRRLLAPLPALQLPAITTDTLAQPSHVLVLLRFFRGQAIDWQERRGAKSPCADPTPCGHRPGPW